LPIPPQIFRDEVQKTGADLLAIADVHAIATTEVPLEYKDPFDRLLLATAQTEHLVLLTGDERLLRLSRLEPTLPVKPAVCAGVGYVARTDNSRLAMQRPLDGRAWRTGTPKPHGSRVRRNGHA
jgi:hypothetical protein